MFGLFKPKPPLGPWEKAWTEATLCQMLQEFGTKPLLEPPTLYPGYEGIPAATDKQSAQQLLEFIKQWMGADFRAHLQIFADSESVRLDEVGPPSESLAIEIHEQHFQDQNLLIAIIARQLANELLSQSDARFSSHWAADLYPAYCGLGVFAANAMLRAKPKAEGLSWWSTQQQGYLPSRIFGYALALRALIRGEDTQWKSSLREDALVSFDDGITYVNKTADSIFHRDLMTRPRSEISVEALSDELKSGSPSRKILAIWDLMSRENLSASTEQRIADQLCACLRDKAPELRAVAASCLPSLPARCRSSTGDRRCTSRPR